MRVDYLGLDLCMSLHFYVCIYVCPYTSLCVCLCLHLCLCMNVCMYVFKISPLSSCRTRCRRFRFTYELLFVYVGEDYAGEAQICPRTQQGRCVD